MSEQTGKYSDDRSAQVEAVQGVVDRVASWQDGATEETVRDELRKGLAEAGVTVPDAFLDEAVRRINHNDGEHFDVAPLLG
jgi:hypothetical protein